MRALLLREVGRPPELADLELEGPREGEVRLRIEASGVCRSDLSVATGVLRSPVPVVLGHEAAGVVLEVGPGVTAPRPGDRVVVSLSPACGECTFCREGRANFCTEMIPGMVRSVLRDGSTRLRKDGQPVHHQCGVASLAEEAVVDARCCVPVPDEVPLSRACLLGCGVLTGYGAAVHAAELGPGRSVAVLGCGGVGLAAVQGARLAGAEPIVAVDLDPGRLEVARDLGATHAVQAGGDVRTAIRRIAPLGVHAAIEAIGRTDTIALAFELLRPGGVAVAVGMPSARETVPIRVGGLFQERRLGGCVYGGGNPLEDLRVLLGLAARGELRLDPMVGFELPLEDAPRAFENLRRGVGLRQVVLPGGAR